MNTTPDDATPDPKDPSLLVNIFGAKPLHEEPIVPPVVTDDDLDEPLPTPQRTCDGETCEACQ